MQLSITKAIDQLQKYLNHRLNNELINEHIDVESVLSKINVVNPNINLNKWIAINKKEFNNYKEVPVSAMAILSKYHQLNDDDLIYVFKLDTKMYYFLENDFDDELVPNHLIMDKYEFLMHLQSNYQLFTFNQYEIKEYLSWYDKTFLDFDRNQYIDLNKNEYVSDLYALSKTSFFDLLKQEVKEKSGIFLDQSIITFIDDLERGIKNNFKYENSRQ